MSTTLPSPPPAAVATVIAGYPAAIRKRVLALRAMLLEVAAATPGVGPIEETLKWGEPAFVTSASGAGSTVRLGWLPRRPDRYAMYFNCQTTLVDSFRAQFPTAFRYDGNRAIVFDLAGDREQAAAPALRLCIALALTYHARKRGAA